MVDDDGTDDRTGRTTARDDGAAVAGRIVLPLALAQFVASYAATNMNVAITAVSGDLDVSVRSLQTTITLFTLTMAALMIPGSKLTDRWGRKRCFLLGLGIYAAGALLASLAQGLPAMLVGYALLEGVGSALMIPPIYILVTVAFADVAQRARWFGVVSGAAGLGSAAGPLIGGVITTTIGWRASFLAQVATVAVTLLLATRIREPARGAGRSGFDLVGAVLSAAGLVLVVLGINAAGTYGWGRARTDLTIAGTELVAQGGLSPVWYLIAAGAIVLAGFVRHIVHAERRGREPLLHPAVFRRRTANLALGAQTAQWLIMQGSFFVISVYVQQVWGRDAIGTGLLLTPATVGILLASAAAGRMARRRSQRSLVLGGFLATAAGLLLVVLLTREDSGGTSLAPGLLVTGLGVGVMLTAAVNIVQSAFPDDAQDDVSGLSRSVSNLGSSLGTALVGSVMVAVARPGGTPFAVAIALLVGFALLGAGLASAIRDDRPGNRPRG